MGIRVPPLCGTDRLDRDRNNAKALPRTAAPKRTPTVTRVKPATVTIGSASALNTAHPVIGASADAIVRSETSQRLRGRPATVLSASAAKAQSSTFGRRGI